MKKVIAATGVTLTLVLGTSVLPANNETSNEAHAATQPYYEYTGYATYDSSFILDPNFVRALKYDNLTLNGYKITSEQQAMPNTTNPVRVYDTTIGINTKSHKAVAAIFPLKVGQITKQDIINAYGPNYTSKSEYTKPTKDSDVMVYSFDNMTVTIVVSNGAATFFTINDTALDRYE